MNNQWLNRMKDSKKSVKQNSREDGVSAISARRKKGIVQQKIPSHCTEREYENNEMSSKWDVKIRQSTDSQQFLNEERSILIGEERKFTDGRNFGQSQLRSQLLHREEDLEEDNTKKMVKFHYHGKTVIYCKESCQLFRKEHMIRKIAVWITEWGVYQLSTLITILTMAVFMGLNNYVVTEGDLREKGGYRSIFSYIKFLYIAYFSLEIVLKVIARGLYQSANSYLRNVNNIFILTVLIIIAIYDTQFIFLLIFRVFSIFELAKKVPFLSYSYNILRLYSVSAESLCKLLFLISFFITLFAILSTNVWSGSMDYRCRTTPIPLQGDWPLGIAIFHFFSFLFLFCKALSQNRLCGGMNSCPSQYYCGSNYDYERTANSYIDSSKMDIPTNQREFNYGQTNYDNMLKSYLTLYQIFMIEGYTNIIYMMQDSHEAYLPVVFAMCYLLVCTYFFNDLIIAVFLTKLQALEAEEQKQLQIKKKIVPSVRFSVVQAQQNNSPIPDIPIIHTKRRISMAFMQLHSKDMVTSALRRTSKIQVSPLPIEEVDKNIRSKYFRKSRNKQKAMKPIKMKSQIVYPEESEAQTLSQYSQKDKTQVILPEKVGEEVEIRSQRTRKMSSDFQENQKFLMNNASPTFRLNSSVFTLKKKITKLPYSPSIIGTSYGNFFNANDEIEDDNKENWNNKIKDAFDILQSNKLFIIFINGCLLCNLIILSFDKYPAFDQDTLTVLGNINLAFISIFLIEDIIRMLQQHRESYFIVLITEIVIDIICFVQALKHRDLVPLSAIKGLRILYFFTNIKSWVNYRILLDAMNHCISSIINMMIVTLAFMYIGTIVGMWIFGGKLKFDSNHKLDLINGISPRFNFDDILSAFTTVFTLVQGDYWNTVWMDCVRSVGGFKSHLYFIFMTIGGRLIFLNSFISIILNSFEFAKSKAQLATKGAKALIDHLSNLMLKKKNRENHNAISLGEIKPPVNQQNQGEDTLKSPNGNYLNPTQPDISQAELLRSKSLAPTPNNLTITPNPKDKEKPFPHSRGFKIFPLKEKIISQGENQIPGAGNKQNDQRRESKNVFAFALKKAATNNQETIKKSNFSVTQILELNNQAVPRIHPKKGFFQLVLEKFRRSSLFIFHYNSRIRITMLKLISSQGWNNFFLVQIFLSSIELAIDNPLFDPNTPLKQVLFIFEAFFVSVFMAESICNIIAAGFINNYENPSKAYMRNTWNVLDLFINVTSLIDVFGFFSSNSLKSIRSLRALRALRPLRVLTKNESLRLLVNALFKTLPLVKSLAFVTFTTTWIFSIFLMSLFKGKFQYCSYLSQDSITYQTFYQNIKTPEDCAAFGGSWKNQDSNFDNIFLSVVSIFKIILGENQSLLMWSSVDSTHRNTQPIKDNNRFNEIFFFFLTFMGNIFTLNLFTGLVVNNFKTIKDELSGYNILTQLQRQWVEMQKFMMKRKLKVVIPSPKNYYRNICFRISLSSLFEKSVLGCIIGNLIAMGCIYKGISDAGLTTINVINNTCLGIYHIEAFIKIFGTGRFYFRQNWNKKCLFRFDFSIILVTDVIIFSGFFISTSTISNLPIIFRALRLGRLIKYIRASHSLKVLIDSVYYLLPSLLNIGALLLLLISVCAILGMNLFAASMVPNVFPSYPYFDDTITYPFQFNFQTITGSFMVIFHCVHNQNWDHFMYLYGFDQENCTDQSYEEQQRDGINGCGTMLSFPFFLFIVLFIRYIVINLFLALVIEGFSETLRESEAIIRPDRLEDILEKWSKYDPTGSGFISPSDMYFLLLEIPEPIGLKNENLQYLMQDREQSEPINDLLGNDRKQKYVFISKKKIFEDLLDFNVRIYSNEKTHFMDFCVKLSRNAIGQRAREKDISDPYFINDRIIIDDLIVEGLMKNWESEFPNLKRLNKRKDENDNPIHLFTILNYFAAKTIQMFFKSVRKNKKIKNQILENNIQTKLSKTENIQTFNSLSNNKRKGIEQAHVKKGEAKQELFLKQNCQLETVHTNEDANFPTLVSQEDTISQSNLHTYPNELKLTEESVKPLFEHKNKYFRKVAIAAGALNMMKNQTNLHRNQERLKLFQNLHNFSIKKDQLGQRFPIKYATDYESLRPSLPSKEQNPKSDDITQSQNGSETLNQKLFNLKNAQNYPNNNDEAQNKGANLTLVTQDQNQKQTNDFQDDDSSDEEHEGKDSLTDSDDFKKKQSAIQSNNYVFS